MFTFFGPVQFSPQKSVITTYYEATKHTTREGLCSYCGVKDVIIKQELKKCYKTVLPIGKECKKFKEPMKWIPHKRAEVQRTIIIFYLIIYMMYLTVLIKVATKKYIHKFKRITSKN